MESRKKFRFEQKRDAWRSWSDDNGLKEINGLYSADTSFFRRTCVNKSFSIERLKSLLVARTRQRSHDFSAKKLPYLSPPPLFLGESSGYQLDSGQLCARWTVLRGSIVPPCPSRPEFRYANSIIWFANIWHDFQGKFNVQNRVVHENG